MKTEEELIWESYMDSREPLDDEIIDEVGYYFYKDNTPIEDIAEEFDLSINQVKSALKQYQIKNQPSQDDYIDPIVRKERLDKDHFRDSIAIDKKKRSDEIDFDKYGKDWEEQKILGKANVTDVKPKKDRPRDWLQRRKPKGEIK
jgi:hypothetical protein